MKRLSYFLTSLFIVFFFVSICCADSNETEPNNDRNQADALVSGTPLLAQLSSDDDQDWYYICTSDADEINVTFALEGAVIATFFYITIEDSQGNVLANRDYFAFSLGDAIETTLSSAVTSAGIYYVAITSGGDIGYDTNYTLTTTVSNPGPCPNEPPDSDVITGIWQVEGQQYFFSANVKGSVMVAVTYIPGAGESFWVGESSDDTWHIYYASNFLAFDATLTLTSENTGTMTVNNCVPLEGGNCIFPAGTTVNIVKIF